MTSNIKVLIRLVITNGMMDPKTAIEFYLRRLFAQITRTSSQKYLEYNKILEPANRLKPTEAGEKLDCDEARHLTEHNILFYENILDVTQKFSFLSTTNCSLYMEISMNH